MTSSPTPTSTITFKRSEPGRQVSKDGSYAVEADGYSPSQSVCATDRYKGFTGGEWAAIFYAAADAATNRQGGENMDWFPTMREAKAECQSHANRSAS